MNFGEDDLKFAMYVFVELFWNEIKIDRSQRKAIYLDEIFDYVLINSCNYCKMLKSIGITILQIF